MQSPSVTQIRAIALITLVALVLRLLFLFSNDVTTLNRGGDTNWLLYAGKALVDGTIKEAPQPGPVYLVYVGLIQITFGDMIHVPEDEPDIVKRFQSVEVVRSPSWLVLGLLNALEGTFICVCVWWLGRRWFSERVGLIAAGLIAINPIFIIETVNLVTESLFLALFLGALALYALKVREDQTVSGRAVFMIGVLVGLATLTRAATLLFPAVLSLHLLYLYRRQAVRLILALGVGYLLALSPWTVYNLVKWNRLVIGAEGIIANIYLGTRPDGWTGPQAIDAAIGATGDGNNQQKYANGAIAAITANPIGYVVQRVNNLFQAVLQPHNTVYYPGVSIKQLFADWWSRGHALSEIGTLTTADNFWPKLLLYIFHFGALGLGLLGLLFSLRRLGERLVLYGTIGYFLALHLVLTAIPRYLFPIEAIWLLFAAFLIAQARRKSRNAAAPL